MQRQETLCNANQCHAMQCHARPRSAAGSRILLLSWFQIIFNLSWLTMWVSDHLVKRNIIHTASQHMYGEGYSCNADERWNIFTDALVIWNLKRVSDMSPSQEPICYIVCGWQKVLQTIVCVINIILYSFYCGINWLLTLGSLCRGEHKAALSVGFTQWTSR